MNKGKCSVIITRTNCSRTDDYMSINIRDELSRTLVAEVRMSMSDFCSALTACHTDNQDYEYGDLSVVGMKKECKVEIIEIGNEFSELKDEEWAEFMAVQASKFEVDGWKAQKVQHNWHHLKQVSGCGHSYPVTLRRYIPVED